MVLGIDDKGKFYTAPLNQPVTILVGDQVVIENGQLVVVRAGIVVATRSIGAAQVADTAAQFQETVSNVLFYKGNPVPGQSVVMTNISQNPTTGVIVITYSNGRQQEYNSWSDIETQLGAMDQEPDLAEKIIALKAYRNSPDGTDKTTMLNVQCAVNFDAGTPIALIEV